jgi:hypothetical protein
MLSNFYDLNIRKFESFRPINRNRRNVNYSEAI